MEVDADDTGVLLIIFLVNVASLRHEEEKASKDVGSISQRPSTVIFPENTKTPILNLRRLLMRRDHIPIIITLAHPENRGDSSYLLASAAKVLRGRGSDSQKKKFRSIPQAAGLFEKPSTRF